MSSHHSYLVRCLLTSFILLSHVFSTQVNRCAKISASPSGGMSMMGNRACLPHLTPGYRWSRPRRLWTVGTVTSCTLARSTRKAPGERARSGFPLDLTFLAATASISVTVSCELLESAVHDGDRHGFCFGQRRFPWSCLCRCPARHSNKNAARCRELGPER